MRQRKAIHAVHARFDTSCRLTDSNDQIGRPMVPQRTCLTQAASVTQA